MDDRAAAGVGVKEAIAALASDLRNGVAQAVKRDPRSDASPEPPAGRTAMGPCIPRGFGVAGCIVPFHSDKRTLGGPLAALKALVNYNKGQ